AMDLVSNQINSLLGQISQDYTLNVNIDQDDLSGDNLYEFGVSKGFLDNRLIVSGSFGVESATTETEPGEDPISEQTLLGDVNIEYVLNDDGTFRINIFNESTDRTVIYEAADKGLFTQGAGLSYKEEFNNIRDFSLVQSFFNIFRKKKNRVRTQKRQDNLVPVEGIKEDEE
ncbi:MAG: translocation/assembly module TamB domain-containing protein, partial [Crocinitomicaceae bacterium]